MRFGTNHVAKLECRTVIVVNFRPKNLHQPYRTVLESALWRNVFIRKAELPLFCHKIHSCIAIYLIQFQSVTLHQPQKMVSVKAISTTPDANIPRRQLGIRPSTPIFLAISHHTSCLDSHYVHSPASTDQSNTANHYHASQHCSPRYHRGIRLRHGNLAL